MARRKNVKRIDPRYFLDETADRNDDGSVLEEVGGAADPPRFSPLSSTKPGERIPVPGSQRPLESRGIPETVEAVGDALADVEESMQQLLEYYKDPVDWPGPGRAAFSSYAPKPVLELRAALAVAGNRFAGLRTRVGEDPRAPRLEEE